MDLADARGGDGPRAPPEGPRAPQAEPPPECPPMPFACTSGIWARPWFRFLIWPLLLATAPLVVVARLMGLAVGIPLLCLGCFLINVGSDQTKPISPLRERLWVMHYYLVCGFLGLVQGMVFIQRNRRLKYHPRAPIAIVNHTSNNDSLAMAHCNPGTPVTKAGLMNNWFFRQIFAASRVLLVGRPPSERVRRWFVDALRDYELHAGEPGHTPAFREDQLDMVRWIVATWGGQGAGAGQGAAEGQGRAPAGPAQALASPFSAFVQSAKDVAPATDESSTVSRTPGGLGEMELLEAVSCPRGERGAECVSEGPGGAPDAAGAPQPPSPEEIDYALLQSPKVHAQAMSFLGVERNRRIYTPLRVSDAMFERARDYVASSGEGGARAAGRGGRWRQTVIFPEGTITDQSCLCRFRTGAFRLGYPVQPITVRYHTLLPQEWLMNGLLHNLLCLLLNPFAVVTVTYHEPMECREGESFRDFADRVGRFMADQLGASYCPYNNDDYLYFNGVKPASVCTPEWRRDFGWMGSWKEFSKRLGLPAGKGLSREVLVREYGKWYAARREAAGEAGNTGAAGEAPAEPGVE